MAKPAKKPTFIQSSRLVTPEDKAYFHNVSGAGKSQVIREFFGFSDGDIDAITRQLEDGIDRILDEQGTA